MQNIRNFVIISHIDHGKSTLADRFLELTGTIAKEKMKEQFLDQMDLERERGITIKMQPVRMNYAFQRHLHEPEGSLDPERPERSPKGEEKDLRRLPLSVEGGPRSFVPLRSTQDDKYILNLIDTPGHVDFSYEVSRSLAAVEGAILLVDATKGVQAQTLNNLHFAQKQKLKIIGVVNKIDLPNAQVEKTRQELAHLLNCDPKDLFLISGKHGQGVSELLQAVVERVPAPRLGHSEPFAIAQDKLREESQVSSTAENSPRSFIGLRPPQTVQAPKILQARGDDGVGHLCALVFDSIYDSYKGAIAYVRIFNGQVKRGDRIKLLAADQEVEVLEVGWFKPGRVACEKLQAGEIGYIATGLKEARLCRVGETITTRDSGVALLPGYQKSKPMVFASFFPHEDNDYNLLTDALNKLKLNDASLSFQPDASPLGRGFLCGFLGLLHLDIIRERLRREYNLDLVITSPSVAYQIALTDGTNQIVTAAANLPEWSRVKSISEPWVSLTVICPQKYLGPVMTLLADLRGTYQKTEYLGQDQVVIDYQVPLAEMMTDFYDQLKSVSSGFASMSYQLIGYQSADLVLMDVLIAQEKFLSLSRLVPRARAFSEGRRIVKKLKDLVPRQSFAVALQAAIGGKVIARETIPAMRKDVTGYLYGGDVTRKKKLLEKQKRGKKRMKSFGRVSLPPKVFFELLKKG
ncbi:MAG: hypothetical protein AUJ33_02680 [Parcubacteria group bacterium CG1_02_40_25]|nr:MAG: hypothetical protein AUJ33_02680 [Parcubacteria group bacterium CG1_02_40_25]